MAKNPLIYIAGEWINYYHNKKVMESMSVYQLEVMIAERKRELTRTIDGLPYWNTNKRVLRNLDDIINQLHYDREIYCYDFNIYMYDNNDIDDMMYESAILQAEELKGLINDYETKKAMGDNSKSFKSPIELKTEEVRAILDQLPFYNRERKQFNNYDEMINQLFIDRGDYREYAGLSYSESDKYIELYTEAINRIKELKKLR